MTFEDALARQVEDVADSLAQHTEVCAESTCGQCAMLKGALLALACLGNALVDTELAA